MNNIRLIIMNHIRPLFMIIIRLIIMIIIRLNNMLLLLLGLCLLFGSFACDGGARGGGRGARRVRPHMAGQATQCKISSEPCVWRVFVGDPMWPQGQGHAVPWELGGWSRGANGGDERVLLS